MFAVLALGASLRVYVPWLYEHFQREEGLFEPLTLYFYLAAAIVLFGQSRELSGAERRRWRFVGGLYLLLGLEEIDYLGIFGRVEGVYAGSLHDLIALAASGVLGLTTWAVIAALFLAVLLVLWWTDYLQPRALWAMVCTGGLPLGEYRPGALALSLPAEPASAASSADQ